MLIIKSEDYLQNEGQQKFLRDVQKLVGQISCSSSNMEYVPGMSNLMRLPIPLLPECALELGNLLHSDESMQASLHKWAHERNIIVEELLAGPQIIWLQDGGLSSKKDRLSFLTVLPRPYCCRRILCLREQRFRGTIDRPIAENYSVQSTFECTIGDTIVLEGGEKLLGPREKIFGTTDICMLVTLYRTALRGVEASER